VQYTASAVHVVQGAAAGTEPRIVLQQVAAMQRIVMNIYAQAGLTVA